MITVIGYGMVIVLIAALLSVYALNSIKGARREQDYNGAITAAQAGVDKRGGQPASEPGRRADTGQSRLDRGAGLGGLGRRAVRGPPVDPGQLPAVQVPDRLRRHHRQRRGLRRRHGQRTQASTERAVKVTVHQAELQRTTSTTPR